MRVVILAGGRGSRLAEETRERPKALVPIGGRPILWHVMAIYGAAGLSSFDIATGHLGEQIEAWVEDARTRGDLDPSWEVRVHDTGKGTASGGRLARLRAMLVGGGTFLLTWCDGLADIDVRALLAFHRAHGRLATVTAVHPPPRFGRLALDGDRVARFEEKPPDPEWVNGAFFALEPAALDGIEGDDVPWERAPLEGLARRGELMAYRHEGFFQCMDTVFERDLLRRLWDGGRAPWNIWA